MVTADCSFFFEKEHDNFLNSAVYKELREEFDYLFLDYFYDEFDYPNLSTNHREEQFDKSVVYYSIFIYLTSIIDDSHNKIADVGCGSNFLKNFFPNIVGYDNNNAADYKEYFDNRFILKHRNEFDVAIAVNSLHFISLKNFASRIKEFGRIIKSSGYGFITFNLQRMIEHTDQDFLKEFSSINDFYDYINQEIKKIDYKIIAYDNLLLYNNNLIGSDKAKNDPFNGNIRLLFQHESQ